MWTGSVIFLACLLQFSIQRSTPQDDSYVAAVVEYRATVFIELNIQRYVERIVEAAKQNADIVVFPEGTLTLRSRSIPVPIKGLLKEYPIPALWPNLYDEVLVRMSSAARENKVYLVVNIQEVMDCTNSPAGEDCPEEKVYRFSTNVVFDRTGAVIDRYRKINLFEELHHPPAPELGIFTTDFGVTFGHFMSFDLMFQVPAMQVVEKYNLTDVIFTTSSMFAEIPYLTGVQIQQAYAYAMNINFLAAGASDPANGFIGSGIYSGKAGALISLMSSAPLTSVLISRVPKTPGQHDFSVTGPIYNNDTFTINRHGFTSDNSLIAHTSRALVPGFQELTLVDKDVSCKFRVRLSQRIASSEPYSYRAAVFDGVRNFSVATTLGNRVCSVLACTGGDIGSCGKRYLFYEVNTTAIFEELTIEATVPTPIIVPELEAHDSAYFPVSLNVNFMPLNSSDFTYTIKEEGENTTYTFTLINSDAELYTFAVWGRKFERDGQEASGPSEPSEPTEPSRSSFVHALCPWLLAAATMTIFSSNRLFK